VKKSRNVQKHLAQRRKGAEAKKKIKGLFTLNLGVSASLREFVHFFGVCNLRLSQAWRAASGPRLM
jgi:hypothetical protein